MALVPPEVKDPSPYLYNSALYTVAGLVGISALAHNFLMKPVDPKYFEVIENVETLNINEEIVTEEN